MPSALPAAGSPVEGRFGQKHRLQSSSQPPAAPRKDMLWLERVRLPIRGYVLFFFVSIRRITSISLRLSKLETVRCGEVALSFSA